MGVGHDGQAALGGEVGEEAVGAVEQAVEMEGAGQGEVGGHNQRRRGQGAERVLGCPPDRAERQSQQRPDEREPHQGRPGRDGGTAQGRQEAQGLTEAAGGYRLVGGGDHGVRPVALRWRPRP
jgi:hypothetical protein